MQLWDLQSANLIRLLRIGTEHAEQTTFTKSDQFSIGQNARPSAINTWRARAVGNPALVALPEKLPGLEVDATEAGIRLIASAEGIEMALMKIGRAHV